MRFEASIIPIKLKNHVGKPLVTGTFYVYDDEALAKTHIDPTIFKRLDKAKKSNEEKIETKDEAKPDESKKATKSDDVKSKDNTKPDESKKDTKSDDVKSKEKETMENKK